MPWLAKAKSSSLYWQSVTQPDGADLWHNPCMSIKLSESNEVRRKMFFCVFSLVSGSSTMIQPHMFHFSRKVDNCLHCSCLNS